MQKRAPGLPRHLRALVGVAMLLILAQPDSAAAIDASDDDVYIYPRASELLGSGCSGDGNSPAYCLCLLSEAEERIFTKLDTEAVAVAYALMKGGAPIAPPETLSILTELSSEDQMAAGIMVGNVSVGDSCAQ